MNPLAKIKQFITPRHRLAQDQEPERGYDLWSSQYDNQPGNLMLALDAQIFAELIKPVLVSGGTIVDVGCGTGRHWPVLLGKNPARLVGYDPSAGMLSRLKEKFPSAETYRDSTPALESLAAIGCDLVVSTLAIAHMADPISELGDWIKLLKPGGYLLITDYHPDLLARGGNRGFSHDNQWITVKNHIHPVASVKAWCTGLGLSQTALVERVIDDTVKPWYAQQRAMSVYYANAGNPLIYGLQFKKPHATLPL